MLKWWAVFVCIWVISVLELIVPRWGKNIPAVSEAVMVDLEQVCHNVQLLDPDPFFSRPHLWCKSIHKFGVNLRLTVCTGCSFHFSFYWFSFDQFQCYFKSLLYFNGIFQMSVNKMTRASAGKQQLYNTTVLVLLLLFILNSVNKMFVTPSFSFRFFIHSGKLWNLNS